MNEYTYEINGKSHVYHVYDDVKFDSLLAAIGDAVSLCYIDEEFHPELVDYAIEYMVLDVLTDIEMPRDLNEAYIIIRAIDGVRSVDADYIADGVRAVVARNEKLLSSMMANANVSRIANLLDDMFQKVGSVVDVVNTVAGKLETSLDGVADKDVTSVLKAFADRTISDEDIATTVLDFQEKTSKKKKSRTTKKVVKSE